MKSMVEIVINRAAGFATTPGRRTASGLWLSAWGGSAVESYKPPSCPSDRTPTRRQVCSLATLPSSPVCLVVSKCGFDSTGCSRPRRRRSRRRTSPCARYRSCHPMPSMLQGGWSEVILPRHSSVMLVLHKCQWTRTFCETAGF